MVEAYNLYIGGYLPKVDPKTNVHNRKELKNKYKSILSMNNAKPLSFVHLTSDMQRYALDVKEMSMELGEAAQNAREGSGEARQESLQKMSELFNALLQRSDEFGLANGKPSRPGGELRNLVETFGDELMAAGFEISEEGYLSKSDYRDALQLPKQFVDELADKCDKMSMNPMEYVEKKVYSYAHLYKNDVGSAYESSIYTGMLFNSYC